MEVLCFVLQGAMISSDITPVLLFLQRYVAETHAPPPSSPLEVCSHSGFIPIICIQNQSSSVTVNPPAPSADGNSKQALN